MASYFSLSSDRIDDDDARLLSHSGTVKGSKVVLTLKVEVGGFWMRNALEQLEEIQRAHKAKPPATRARKPKVKSLEKSAPLLALPAPGGRHEP